MTNITYNAFSLQSSSIRTSEIQHEDISQKNVNIQRFSRREGGRISDIGFNTKNIRLSGTIVGSSKADLEDKIDQLKKYLNVKERNLDIDYSSGTRRYKATCTMMKFGREHYTVTSLPFEAEFVVNNPPMGMGLDTHTLEDLGNSLSNASTVTLEASGYADFSGTFRPLPKIKITVNTVNGCRDLRFQNIDEDKLFTRTVIRNQKLYNGDIIIIDCKEGTVTLNGEAVEFNDGFPHFTLSNNRYTLKAIAKSFNIDIKIIYYDLWL